MTGPNRFSDREVSIRTHMEVPDAGVEFGFRNLPTFYTTGGFLRELKASLGAKGVEYAGSLLENNHVDGAIDCRVNVHYADCVRAYRFQGHCLSEMSGRRFIAQVVSGEIEPLEYKTV